MWLFLCCLYLKMQNWLSYLMTKKIKKPISYKGASFWKTKMNFQKNFKWDDNFLLFLFFIVDIVPTLCHIFVHVFVVFHYGQQIEDVIVQQNKPPSKNKQQWALESLHFSHFPVWKIMKVKNTNRKRYVQNHWIKQRISGKTSLHTLIFVRVFIAKIHLENNKVHKNTILIRSIRSILQLKVTFVNEQYFL